MKFKYVAVAVLSAIALGVVAHAADFRSLEKITSSEPIVKAVSLAIEEEIHEYPEKAWDVLRIAMGKVTSDWTADEVIEMIRRVFGVMRLEEVERVIPQVKTLVDWYSDAYADGVAEQVIASLEYFQLCVEDARLSARAVEVVTDRTGQTAPTIPDETPAMPPDASVN